MATLDTSDLALPPRLAQRAFEKIQNGSTVAALGQSEPMQFGEQEFFDFDIGEAEYVGEGSNKSGSAPTKSTVQVSPYKFQKTIRVSDEFVWADESYQLGVMERLADQIPGALARALDFGVYHGIDPLSGAAATAMAVKLSDTTNKVELESTDKPYALIDAADQLVLADGYVPSDVALDPALAARFAGLRNATTEQKLYPDFRLGTAVSTLEGHNASTSRTVGAVGTATVDTNVQAFVGDFSKIVWGVQKRIGIEMIRYGDPDGGGDLKRNNQVALRAEVVYGWAIADLDAFAVITDAAADGA